MKMAWVLLSNRPKQIQNSFWNCLAFLRPGPHISGYFWIHSVFFPDSNISPSTRGVFKSNSPVHTHPMVQDRIRKYSLPVYFFHSDLASGLKNSGFFAEFAGCVRTEAVDRAWININYPSEVWIVESFLSKWNLVIQHCSFRVWVINFLNFFFLKVLQPWQLLGQLGCLLTTRESQRKKSGAKLLRPWPRRCQQRHNVTDFFTMPTLGNFFD